jgi:hypothetical protein
VLCWIKILTPELKQPKENTFKTACFMELEIIMVSEISWTQKANTTCFLSYAEFRSIEK